LNNNGLRSAQRRFAKTRLLVEMCITAIALERFHQRHRTFPDTLHQLVPGFLPSLPRDWMDGQTLRYRHESQDAFRLWSTGEDGRDDGGDATVEHAGDFITSDWFTGRDIVWPQPASASEVQKFNRYLERMVDQMGRNAP